MHKPNEHTQIWANTQRRMRIRRQRSKEREKEKKSAWQIKQKFIQKSIELGDWDQRKCSTLNVRVRVCMCLCTILLLFRWLFFLHRSLLLRSSSSLLILFGSVLVPAHQLFVNEKWVVLVAFTFFVVSFLLFIYFLLFEFVLTTTMSSMCDAAAATVMAWCVQWIRTRTQRRDRKESKMPSDSWLLKLQRWCCTWISRSTNHAWCEWSYMRHNKPRRTCCSAFTSIWDGERKAISFANIFFLLFFLWMRVRRLVVLTRAVRASMVNGNITAACVCVCILNCDDMYVYLVGEVNDDSDPPAQSMLTSDFSILNILLCLVLCGCSMRCYTSNLLNQLGLPMLFHYEFSFDIFPGTSFLLHSVDPPPSLWLHLRSPSTCRCSHHNLLLLNFFLLRLAACVCVLCCCMRFCWANTKGTRRRGTKEKKLLEFSCVARVHSSDVQHDPKHDTWYISSCFMESRYGISKRNGIQTERRRRKKKRNVDTIVVSYSCFDAWSHIVVDVVPAPCV